MALEAVRSFARLLDQMLQHQHVIVEDRKLAESLLEEVNSFRDILESCLEKSSEDLELLRSQIINSANHARDFIESHIRDQLAMPSRGSKNEISITISSQCLEKVKGTIYFRKEWVMKIEEENRLHDLEPRTSSSVAGLSEHGPPSGKISALGLDDDFEQIVKRLVTGSKQLQIVSVVGMGGIGKTTLAMKVYSDSNILRHFDIKIWATVSQSYDVQQTLLNLLSSIKSEKMHENLKITKENLYKCLKGRRYLIVLDDVWDTKIFGDFKLVFPNDNQASRILLTTRLETVAVDQANSCLHRMYPLNKAKSWNLFCQKVFGQDHSPPEVEKIGKNIVQSCGGNPLAINVLAGFLSKAPKTHQFWKSFADENLSSEIIQNDEKCLKMLSLSYIHLPSHLKECFLYIGIFPEDTNVQVFDLVNLWIAEGFIEQMGSKSLEDMTCEKQMVFKSLEDVGYDYLLDLIDRSLVIMVGELSPLGKVEICKLHDLVREFCIKEAKSNRFFHITDGSLYDIPVGDTLCRLSIHQNVKNIFPCDEGKLSSLSVRSLVSFDRSVPISAQLQNLGPLRVVRMCCQSFPVDNQVEENGLQLHNLRYLNCLYDLKEGDLKLLHCEFPTTLSNMLQNLQTLIIGRLRVSFKLDIWNMPKLRHVNVDPLRLCDPPKRRSSVVLEHLQTACRVCSSSLSKEVLKRIPNVKELTIQYFFSSASFNNISHLQKLEALSMHSLHVGLRICKCKSSLPSSLRKLTLSGWKLAQEDMQMIGRLPNLEVLELHECKFINSEWEIAEGEFSSLKYLKLDNLNLLHWKADSISFPSLQCLYVNFCIHLIKIPSEIGFILTLQLIKLYHCKDSLVAGVKEMLAEQRDLGNEDLQVHIKPQR